MRSSWGAWPCQNEPHMQECAAQNVPGICQQQGKVCTPQHDAVASHIVISDLACLLTTL